MATDSPWRAPMRFSEASRGPVSRSLEADAAARAAIARLLGLESVEALTAEIAARAWMDGVQLDGRFSAEVTYICSVSADPFPEKVSGEFMVRVLPAGSLSAPQEQGEEIDLDPDADDPPDVLEGEEIDLGAYVVEHLSLELDPFPRKPGAEFEPPVETAELSPFAVLRVLKKDDAAK